MAEPTKSVDLEDGDETIAVTRESSRGGNEPPPDVNDRPDQNLAYDEVVRGRPLTDDEHERAVLESPLAPDSKNTGGDPDSAERPVHPAEVLLGVGDAFCNWLTRGG
jgi:hypothetical protein